MSAAETTACEVPAAARLSLECPHVLALPNGKWLVSFDQTGPDVKDQPGKKKQDDRRRWMQGRVYASSDEGATWKLSATYPFRRATLFRDGGDVYLLGEAAGALQLMRSPDGGGSWSAPMELTSPSADRGLLLAPGAIEAVESSWMLAVRVPSGDGLGLQLYRAPRGASLMNRKAWTAGPVGDPMPPAGAWRPDAGFAVPVGSAKPGWRNPVPVFVPSSVAGEPLVVVPGATSSGRAGWCVWMQTDPVSLRAAPVRTPDGEPWYWRPWPGGHDTFAVARDPASGLYALAAQQPTGPAWPARAAAAATRRRIGLWASDDLVDWRPLGTLFAGGDTPDGLRADPAIAFSGGSLVAVCRAGGPASRNDRDGRRILCRRIPDFRRLAAAAADRIGTAP